jgi:sugar/nucleoside kinase (ribokinase family)
MSFAYDFIGAGGLAYDLVMTVKDLPLADEKYPAEIVGKLPGGFIANATCAAGRLGLRAAFIGWVGDDSEGEMLRQDFIRCSVSPGGLVTVPGAVTPFTIVITDRHGQRAILIPHFPLYSAELTDNQIALAGQARAVFTFPRDRVWCSRFRAATMKSGGLFALDIESSIPMLRDDLLHVIEMADVLFFSEDSLKRFNLAPIQKLVDQRQWIIMTAGSKGAYGIEHGRRKPVFAPAQRVAAVVDTTGAGDCFHAALIAAKLDGATLEESLKFASASAAIKIQHQGARGGLPTRSEIEHLLITTSR